MVRVGTVGLVLLVGAILGGCSTQARRADCEGKLRPINAPAPVAPEAMRPEAEPR